MTSMIVDYDELPGAVTPYFQTGKVELVEKGGRVTLSPIVPVDDDEQWRRYREAVERTYGMLEGTGVSSEEFMRGKRLEKELEG